MDKMQKPSPQFIEHLEQKLRIAYKLQYQTAPVSRWESFKARLKIVVPALSGALVLMLVLMNVFFKQSLLEQAAKELPTGNEIASLEGSPEEDLISDFDGDELNKIDQSVTLAVAN